MKRYTPTLEAFSWANSEDCDTEVHPVMAETPDGAYVKRDEAEAECERLRRGVSEAREAVGEGWFAGGATLAQAIRRKVHVLECERENRLADEHPPAPVEGPPPGGLLPEMTIDEVRAECERLRREYAQLRREHMDLIDADIVLIRRHAAREEELRALRNPPAPVEGPGDGLRAECERLRRGLRDAREAVGERWFAGGATLAQAIKRKVRFLEERLPEDPVLTCARCGPTPHRWRPSPEAGPHWRCSECGEITGPEGGAR